MYRGKSDTGIKKSQILNWDTAYSWGDHSVGGYYVNGASGFNSTGIDDNATGTVLTLIDATTTFSNDVAIGSEIFFDASSARLGLGGQTSPDTEIHVGTTLESSSDIILQTSNTGSSHIYFADSALFSAYIGYSQSVDALILKTRNAATPEIEIVASGVYVNTALSCTDLTVSGTISAPGYNPSNWDTAFGWGDHAAAGYAADNNVPVAGDKRATTLTDWNSPTQSGFYDGDSAANAPGTSWYWGLNIAHSNNPAYGWQMVQRNGFDDYYVRYQANSSWGGWKRLWHSGDFSTTNVSNWNTAYSWGDHSSQGYLTGNQTITLSGDVSGSGTTSISVTVNDDSHWHSQVYIPDTRGAQRAPSYYPDRYVSWDFQNRNDTLAGGDTWNVLQTIAPWSTYSNSHRQQQLAFTGTGGIKFRYATSDSAWAPWQTLLTSDGGTVDGQIDFGNVRIGADDHRPGLLGVWNDTGSWGGIQIRNGAWEYALMGDNSGSVGLYNDNNNEWIINCVANGGVRLYHNGASKLATVSNGISVTGAVTASGDVTAFSDVRLKSNVETVDWSATLRMRGVTYEKDGKQSSGVIAQELQTVAPELVHDDNEYLAVNYGGLSAYLIETIKHQQERIERLEALLEQVSGVRL